jgi:hypothetical protein
MPFVGEREKRAGELASDANGTEENVLPFFGDRRS